MFFRNKWENNLHFVFTSCYEYQFLHVTGDHIELTIHTSSHPSGEMCNPRFWMKYRLQVRTFRAFTCGYLKEYLEPSKRAMSSTLLASCAPTQISPPPNKPWAYSYKGKCSFPYSTVPPWPLASYVLGRSLHLHELQFSHMKTEVKEDQIRSVISRSQTSQGSVGPGLAM